MRLKYEFVMMELDGKAVAVPADGMNCGFDGGVRLNRTAAFVFELLQEGATEQELLAALEQKYAAPQEVLHTDLQGLLGILRQKGLIEE